MKIKRVCILEEMPITDLSLAQVQKILQARVRGRVSTVLMADMAQCMRCAKNEEELSFSLTADLILAEGEDVRVAAAMMGTALSSEAFSAEDLIVALMQTGTERFFFLGGESGHARRAAFLAAKRAGRTPCPSVGGAHGNFARNGRENTAVLTRIWECQPDVVVVCLKDGIVWLGRNREKLPPALYICMPERIMREMAEVNAVQLRERMPLEAWRHYRMRLAFYQRVRRKMKKAAE